MAGRVAQSVVRGVVMTGGIRRVARGVACGVAVAAAGCQTTDGTPRPLFGERGPLPGQTPRVRPADKAPPADSSQLPKELNMVTMPPYMVEAPDFLLIDAKRLIPLPPYKIEPLDVLYLVSPETKQPTAPDRVIDGPYSVQPDGTIDLGPDYGAPIRVNDMLVADAEKLIQERVRTVYDKATVRASLAQAAGTQQIRGEHLVQPDGTVALGLYGAVHVAGRTLPQVKQAIEEHLARFLYKPEVSVQVSAFNSKVYYVITDFAGAGEQVQRIPSTGNERVLDAISYVGGLSAVSSKQIWVARPAPPGVGDQILPVDWKGITRRASTETNFQILPGDRVFVMGQPLTKVDTALGRAFAPIDRTLGTLILGGTASQTLSGNGLFGRGNGNNGGTTNVIVPRQ